MAAKDKKPLLELSDCETYARARFTTYPGCSESQLAKYKREHGIVPEWIYAGSACSIDGARAREFVRQVGEITQAERAKRAAEAEAN